jgi:hypothetical protein
MGIDVYLKWDGMPEIDVNWAVDRRLAEAAYATKYSPDRYIREAYHGGPYATQFLFPEAWGRRLVRSTVVCEGMLAGLSGLMAAKGMTVAALHEPAPPAELDAPRTPPRCSRSVRTVEWTETYIISGKPYKQRNRGQVYPPALLRARLPLAQAVARERAVRLYKATPKEAEQEARHLAAFVDHYAALLADGKNPRVRVSY